jgi:thiamine pyrophosphate-dependent acetolactate synthase large subunit-like protein
MKGSDVVAAQLAAENVDTVLTIPGVHNVHLCDSLLDFPQIRILTGRHEQGLTLMANGYTRASGKIAVPIVISGPGVTNSLTALADAYLDSVPMVLVAAASDAAHLGRGALHELKDQTGILASVCKWNVRIEDVREIPGAMRTAFEQARGGRPGPTAVEIPLEVQWQSAAVEVAPSARPGRPRANPVHVAEAVARLTASRSPLMYIGSGAALSDAGAKAVELAERLNMPCFTTAGAKGTFPEDHPLSLGTGIRRPPIANLLEEADLVLVVGSSLDEVDTALWRLRLPANLIQIDIAPEIIGRNHSVAVGLEGDAKAVLRQLLDQLEAVPMNPDTALLEKVAALKAAERVSLNADPGWQYMRAIQSVLAEDTIVTNDAATANAWALYYLERTLPRTMNISSALATLGFAVPSALGAKAAFPDRQVLAIVGDGGFLFGDYLLATAVQHRLGIVIVLFNDNAYSTIQRQQIDLFGRAVATDLHNPDFPALAASFGAVGAVARTPAELAVELAAAWQRELPTLIEVPI